MVEVPKSVLVTIKEQGQAHEHKQEHAHKQTPQYLDASRSAAKGAHDAEGRKTEEVTPVEVTDTVEEVQKNNATTGCSCAEKHWRCVRYNPSTAWLTFLRSYSHKFVQFG